MGELSYTVGGDSNLVNFKSAARVPITSLKVHFKPKQDLHGYSKPWPAGGGKNLIGNNFITGKTINSSGEVITNLGGMMTTDYIEVSSMSYVWSGVNKYTDNQWNYRVHGYDENKDWVEQITYQSVNKDASYNIVFTPNENIKYIRLSFNEQTNNNQIEKGSAATSYEPYENICPIEGYNSVSITRTGKNIARITGYGTQNGDNINGPLYTTNYYGTSINSTSFSSPDTPLVVMQSQWPNTSTINNYANGYLTVFVDNLEFDKYYDVSFKITNIQNNPLSASLNSIRLLMPKGNAYSPYKTDGNTLFFRNVKWERYANKPTRSNFEIRNCGMSFTLSEFMVTNANTNDGVFEPYCGEIIPVTFPITGKNKFDYSNADIANIKRRDDNGDEVTDASGSYCQLLIPVIPNTTYTLSGYTNNNVSKRIYFIQEDETFISRTAAFGNDSYTFTTPNNCYYIQIQNREIANAGWETVQLELGDTATAYEPYSADNTFYGGYVDIAKSEVIAEWINKTALWGNIKNNYPDSTTGIDSGFIYFEKPIMYATAGGDSTNSFCNVGRYAFAGRDYSVSHFYPGTRNGMTCSEIYLHYNTDDNTIIQTVLKLQTPIHYPLSKTELKTFISQNSVWSNTNGATEVSYAIHDTAPIRAAKHRIAANEPHIETADGSIAHFETDMAAPLKECKVYFTPKQDTNGYGKVWVGGGGNNIWDEQWEVGRFDVTTGVNVVSNDQIRFKNYVSVLPNTEYRFVGVSSLWMIPFDENKNVLQGQRFGNAVAIAGNSSSVNAGNTFTTPENCYFIKAYLIQAYGATYKNDIAINYPSSVTTYSPYENICPITGWTGLQVHSAGKNLLRLPVMTRTYNGITWTVHEDGSIDVDGTSSAQYAFMSGWNNESQHKTFLLKAGTYVLSGNNSKLASIYLVARDGSTSANIGGISRYYTHSTFTLAQDTLVGFQAAVADTDGEVHFTFRPQLELVGPSEYESPNYDTIDVDWEDDFGTIYGGYIDLKKQVLIQTHKSIILNGSENWGNYGENMQQIHFWLSIPDKKIGSGTSVSSIFPNVKNTYFWDRKAY